jgi:hypothetical protein
MSNFNAKVDGDDIFKPKLGIAVYIKLVMIMVMIMILMMMIMESE